MKYLRIILLLAVVTAFSSCFKDNDKSFNGPTVLEFKPILRTVARTAGNGNALVQLVGPQSGSPLTIPYTVDPASTAVSGQHYTIANSGSLTIAANSSSGTIPITLNATATVPAGGVRLIIHLAEGGPIKPNPNYRTYTLTINP